MTTNESPIKNGEKTELYQESLGGKFKAGNPGGGRPKGSFSITALVKAELQELAPGEDKKTHAQRFIATLFKKAIEDGNETLMKSIWAYIDGQPKETKEHKGEINIIVNNDGNKYSLPIHDSTISEELLDNPKTEEGNSLAS